MCGPARSRTNDIHRVVVVVDDDNDDDARLPHSAQESRRIGFARRKHGEDGRGARLRENRQLLVRSELVGEGALGRKSWGQDTFN